MAKSGKKQDKTDNQKEIKEKYMELQLINQQMEEFQKQIKTISEQIEEIRKIKEALYEFRNFEAGSKMLAPISSGIFVKAKVENTNELLVNVGGNTIVAKSVDATKALLERQLTEIRNVYEELEKNQALMHAKAQKLGTELQKMIG